VGSPFQAKAGAAVANNKTIDIMSAVWMRIE
jgi:hypothetical protein